MRFLMKRYDGWGGNGQDYWFVLVSCVQVQWRRRGSEHQAVSVSRMNWQDIEVWVNEVRFGRVPFALWWKIGG